jgi:prophage regulatory protein
MTIQTNPVAPAIPEKMLRLPAVSEAVGFQRSAIYARIQNGTFPAPIKIGKRASAWPASAIQAWIQAQIRGASSGVTK